MASDCNVDAVNVLHLAIHGTRKKKDKKDEVTCEKEAEAWILLIIQKRARKKHHIGAHENDENPLAPAESVPNVVVVHGKDGQNIRLAIKVCIGSAGSITFAANGNHGCSLDIRCRYGLVLLPRGHGSCSQLSRSVSSTQSLEKKSSRDE